MFIGGQSHTPAALPLGKGTVTHHVNEWEGPTLGLDGCGKSYPQRDLFLMSYLP